MATLEGDLTCPVCGDIFTSSQLLPCSHSICPRCIREVWVSLGEGVGRFSCPQCQEQQEEVFCDCCSPESQKGQPPLATKTCLRCEVSMCVEHLQPHLQRPAFSTHLLVDPLGDLDQRRCQMHKQILRYYCLDEKVYLCGDCLLRGGHAMHRVQVLEHVEEDLKAILKTLLQRATERLEYGEQLLKDHQNVDCTMVDDEDQLACMGSDLQNHVRKMIDALREITNRERQQAKERVQDDCCRITEDMKQTQSIQHYLSSLMTERDPFLLIWAFQSDDTKLVADLNSPLFIPDPVSLDRKHIVEDIENEYRRFITATLHSLRDLKRELLTSPLLLDTNSAHPFLRISDDLRTVSRVKTRLHRPPHPQRFDHWPQVLTMQTCSSGTHLWELKVEGFWDVGVCYKSIGRKGKEGNAFGKNKVSWSLTQQHDKLAVWHDHRKSRLAYRMTGNRLAVTLDYDAGTIVFSEVEISGNLTHIHTFSSTFTQPVCLGLGLYKAEHHSCASIVKV